MFWQRMLNFKIDFVLDFFTSSTSVQIHILRHLTSQHIWFRYFTIVNVGFFEGCNAWYIVISYYLCMYVMDFPIVIFALDKEIQCAPSWLYIVRLISGLEHYYSRGTQHDGLVGCHNLFCLREGVNSILDPTSVHPVLKY